MLDRCTAAQLHGSIHHAKQLRIGAGATAGGAVVVLEILLLPLLLLLLVPLLQ
jgi:hypothetical protein